MSVYQKIFGTLKYIIINLKRETKKISMESLIKKQEQNDQISSELLKLTSNNEKHTKIWNSGHWSLEQNAKCIAFFQFNKAHLHSKLKMKENKFFKQMSIFVESRSPIQCRSQCQKLLRKHRTFYNVIHHFKSQYDQDKFEQEYAQHSHNPLIRFKGSTEMIVFEKQTNKSKQVSIQTDKSYLLRKSKFDLRKQPVKNQRLRNSNTNQFPFLKAGWWL